MPTFTFLGRVLPRRLPLTLKKPFAVEIVEAETIQHAIFKVSIKRGKIRVDVETMQNEELNPDDIYQFAMDYVRAAVELATVASGVAYIPIIERAIYPNGDERAVVLADRKLASIMTVLSEYEFDDVLGLILKEGALARSISDVIAMLTWPHYAPIAAGRVMESILRMLTNGRSPKDWQKMRDTLRIDKAYLKLIADHAVGPRHGDRQRIDGPTNSEIAARSWTLMNRFLAYRLSGDQPLNEMKFPQLEG